MHKQDIVDLTVSFNDHHKNVMDLASSMKQNLP